MSASGKPQETEAAEAVGCMSFFDALSEAVLLLDDFGGILTANTAAEALLGRTRRLLAGANAAEFLPQARSWFSRRTLAPDEADSTTLALPAVDLERGLLPALRVCATFTALMPRPPECPKRATVILEVVDLDAALRAERDEAAEAGRAANGELLRNLAHEIKNPLGGIRGAAQLLESELMRAEDRECTSVILEEADRLQQLVDRLLMPYRIPPALGPVNIHEVLEHVRSLIGLEFSAGLSIERDYDISAPAVTGDRGRFTQVFLNLARNAAEAMTEERARGEARIVFKTRIARDVVLAGVRSRRALRIDVLDNGPGVPERLREKIFFPLVTGRPEGSGLGLSLVKTFVEEAGGSISLESRPGRTDFTVLLPLECKAAKKQ